MTHARILVSLYSIGSIAGAVLNAIVINRFIDDESALMGYTLCSFITLLLMTMVIDATVMSVGAFIIGFSAAGGVMQIGLTVMSKLFPEHKGKVTGIYYTAGSISSFTIPLITGWLSKGNIRNIMWLDVLIAFLGVLCSFGIHLITKKQPSSDRFTQPEFKVDPALHYDKLK